MIRRLLCAMPCLALLWLTAAPSTATAQACIQPPAQCHITSAFGPRFNPITRNYSSEFHRGVDFGCPMFSTIVAADSGLVDTSGWSDTAGNWIRVRRPGVTYKYMHHERNLVTIGAAVSAGQEIAKSGNTGRSTGPHLHFQVEEGGIAVDPMSRFCSKPPMKPGILDGGLPANSDLISNDQQASPPTNASVPPMGLDGSLFEMLSDAIGSRAMNPSYASQLQELNDVGLYRELAYQQTLRLRTRSEAQRSLERRLATEALLNLLIAERTLRPRLDRQRGVASAAERAR